MKIICKIILVSIISVFIIFGFSKQTTINDYQIFVKLLEPKKEGTKTEVEEKPAQKRVPDLEAKEIAKVIVEKRVSTSSVILLDVPFTAQAPYGEWSDQRQQDGCEETSALMAVAWARAEKIDKKKAKKEILAIAEYEKNKYGSFVDTNAKDTIGRIIKGYFNYDQAKVIANIALDDIKFELYKGNLVLVPCNGRRLGNPNYTPPGPERHMLLIRGYDPIKKEFITNDAGTRNGEKFRYQEDILYKAIVNYPTGDHVPIQEEKKTMIVVWK